MSVSTRAVLEAILERLGAINGEEGGFHTDLEGRVYSRLILPTDAEEIRLPYLVADFCGEGQGYEGDPEETWIRTKFRVTIHGFVAPDNGARNPRSVLEAADLKDDIARALLQDRTLGGTARTVSLVASNTFAGIEASEDYGEVVSEFEVLLFFDASDLAAT